MKVRQSAMVAGLALGLMSGVAEAAYVIDVNQVGADVVAKGSGSIDTTDLTLAVGATYQPVGAITPSSGELNLSTGLDNAFSGTSGPSSFGDGSTTFADTSFGQSVAFYEGMILLPKTYVSGTELGPSSDSWDLTTLAKLGVDQGKYVYTWGTGAHADSLTLNVGTVPLPSSAPMFGAALMALGAVGYGLKRKAKAAA